MLKLCLFALLLTARSCLNGGGTEMDAGASMDAALDGQAIDAGSTLREYGTGEHAIFLSAPAPRYCWFIGETNRICPPGRRMTSYQHMCVDDEEACLALLPDDEERDGRCNVTTRWQSVGRDALYGDCAKRTAYWNGDPAVQCLFHSHCNEGGRCVDYQCDCGGRPCDDPITPTQDAGMEADAGTSPMDAGVAPPDAGHDAGAGPAPPG